VVSVVCATASRYYERRDLYSIATDFASEETNKALFDGPKTIDVCQAVLILSVYPVPKKKWADDRSWVFLGIGIKYASAP
jgi:transcriptional regulatory protein LEU3